MKFFIWLIGGDCQQKRNTFTMKSITHDMHFQKDVKLHYQLSMINDVVQVKLKSLLEKDFLCSKKFCACFETLSRIIFCKNDLSQKKQLHISSFIFYCHTRASLII